MAMAMATDLPLRANANSIRNARQAGGTPRQSLTEFARRVASLGVGIVRMQKLEQAFRRGK